MAFHAARWIVNKCRCECKKHYRCEKGYIWNPATCSWKNGKYLASIIDNSVITCEEVRDAEAKPYGEETKATAANFNEKIAICKTKKLYILLASLLITIPLLLAVIS